MGKVTVIRTTGGLGRRLPNEDNYSAIVMNGVAVTNAGITTPAALNTVYELNSVGDAESLGLDADYDADNVLLVHHHIAEFFRLCPDGKLFVMLVAQSVSLTQMADKTTTNGLAKLLRHPLCNGKVRQAAVIRNPDDAYTPTTTDFIDVDVALETTGTYSGAIVKAQQLAEEERELHRPVFILVEGRSMAGTATQLLDLRPSRCNKVAVVLAQDKDVADIDPVFEGYAAAGACLGMIARRKVNECIGWVEPGNIQSQDESRFIVPALSSNTLLSDYSNTDQDLIGGSDTQPGKGYIMPKVYVDYPGVYFSDSPTCTTTDDDYAFIENNRTMDKAERLVYKALVPKVNSPQLVDAETGQLPPSVCKYFESLAEDALADMVKSRECSSVDAYVDPEQNIIADNKLEVKISIVPTGKASFITAVLGFRNPFKA